MWNLLSRRAGFDAVHSLNTCTLRLHRSLSIYINLIMSLPVPVNYFASTSPSVASSSLGRAIDSFSPPYTHPKKQKR